MLTPQNFSVLKIQKSSLRDSTGSRELTLDVADSDSMAGTSYIPLNVLGVIPEYIAISKIWVLLVVTPQKIKNTDNNSTILIEFYKDKIRTL